MARKTPDLNKAVQSFKNMEQAVTKLGASFRSIFAPLSGLSRELQNLAKRSDLSRSTGVSIDKLNKFGAAFKRLGGDVKTAGNVFGSLDREWRNLKEGFSSAKLGDLARLGMTFDETDMADADKMFAKIRKVMADPNISDERKRSLKERLGLDDAAFRLATMSAVEYKRAMEDAASLNFDTTRQREMTKNAEKWREATGRLSAAWEKFKTALADCLTVFTPVVNGLASLISWLAESKAAVWSVFSVMMMMSGFGIIRFVKRIYDIYKALRGINNAMKVTTNASNFFARSWKALTNVLGRGAGWLKTTWNWLNKIGRIKITPLKWIKGAGTAFSKLGGLLGNAWRAIKAFRLASIANAFSRLWAVIKGGRGAFSVFAKGGHLVTSLLRGLKGCLNVTKMFTGAVKVVGKSLLSALMFAIDGVTVAVKNFKKYIWDEWDSIVDGFKSQMSVLFSGNIGDIGQMFIESVGAFMSGLTHGVVDVFDQLLGWALPDSWMEGIRNWVDDLTHEGDQWFSAFGQMFNDFCKNFSWGDIWKSFTDGCKSAWDGIKNAFSEGIDWIGEKWTSFRKMLPTWLGGIEETEEEKKEREAKERKEVAQMQQAQYESWSPQKKLDYDFSQVGAATNLPDLRNISIPTANLPSSPTLSSFPDLSNIKVPTANLSIPKLNPDILKNLEVAGQRVGAANNLAAGASAMMQSTYDYSMSSSSQTIAPSIRIDSINVNAGNTSDPKKLASGLNSELNKYMFYGLEATGAWTR